MMGGNDLNSGADSINVQGSKQVSVKTTTNNNYGVSYESARQIAIDVFKANFYELSETAQRTAMERVEAFTEKLIERLKEEQESILDSLKEPEMQVSLFEAQKTYARSGEEIHSEFLIELLVEKSKQKERTLLQITLSECIEILPKLTREQIEILTLVFECYYVSNYMRTAKISASAYFRKRFLEIAPKKFNMLDFQHFNYLGCAFFEPLKFNDPYQAVIENYNGLFNYGFTMEEFKSTFGEGSFLLNFIIDHYDGSGKFLFIGSRKDYLARDMYLNGVADNDIQKSLNLLNKYKINRNDFLHYVSALDKELVQVFKLLEQNGIKNTWLTGVGVVIAILNLKFKGVQNIQFEDVIK